MKIKATKTSMYNIVKDHIDVTLPRMIDTEFRNRQGDYVLEGTYRENGIFRAVLMTCMGNVVLMIERKDDLEKKESTIELDVNELINRKMIGG